MSADIIPFPTNYASDIRSFRNRIDDAIGEAERLKRLSASILGRAIVLKHGRQPC